MERVLHAEIRGRSVRIRVQSNSQREKEGAVIMHKTTRRHYYTRYTGDRRRTVDQFFPGGLSRRRHTNTQRNKKRDQDNNRGTKRRRNNKSRNQTGYLQHESQKAPGMDGITTDIAVSVFDIAPDLITDLFNTCLENGVFPEE